MKSLAARMLSVLCVVPSASIFVLSGCIALPIPHERQLTPLYFGTVKDASTAEPIQSATVSVTALTGFAGSPSYAESQTDSSGRYEVAVTEKAKWFILLAGPAEGDCGGALRFVHPEYETVRRETSEFRGGAVDGVCRGAKRQVDVFLRKRSQQ